MWRILYLRPLTCPTYIAEKMDKDIAQCHQFKHFFVHCQRDLARLSSYEEISLHRSQTKEDKDEIGIRMVCSECGGFFTSARSLAQHINRRGFRHRRSKIVNYNKETFNPNAVYQIRDAPPKRPRGQQPQSWIPEDRQKVAAKISNSRHGFRKGRSCLTNLLTFLDKVTSYVDSGEDVDVVFLDFAKAFE